MAIQIWLYMQMYYPLSKLEKVGCGLVAKTTICLSEEYHLIISLILMLSLISSLHHKMWKLIGLGLCFNSIKYNWNMTLNYDSYT